MTAVLGYKTFMDVVNSYTTLDAKGVYLEIAEVLNRKCPLLGILPMEPTNLIMSHIGTRRSTLMTPQPRTFNKGIVPTATHTTPLTEGIAMYEDYSEVDKKLCDIQNDPTQFRKDEDLAKIESFHQSLEYGLFYNSLTSDGRIINGLATRFNSLSTYPNGDSTWTYNVVDGGSSVTRTSIWLIEFGKKKVYGLYPKNLPAGLSHRDLGEVTKESGYSESVAGSLYQVYRTHFSWDIGLFIADERCVQRYANINSVVGGANEFDEQQLITLKNQLPSMGEDAGTCIICNRQIKTQMDIRAVSQKTNTYFTQNASTGDVWGRPVTRFQGIPVIVAEMIGNAETAAS